MDVCVDETWSVLHRMIDTGDWMCAANHHEMC